MRSLEEEIRELKDIEAIRKLKFRYAALADKQDGDALAQLLTEDCVWDGGAEFGRYEGRTAIRSFLIETWKSLTWAIHLTTNPDIEIAPSGDEATARWYLWEPATISGRPLWMVGKYVDRCRKVNGQWLFAHIEIRFDFMTPFESGWVKERFASL